MITDLLSRTWSFKGPKIVLLFVISGVKVKHSSIPANFSKPRVCFILKIYVQIVMGPKSWRVSSTTIFRLSRLFILEFYSSISGYKLCCKI